MAKNPLIRSYPKKVNAPLQKKSAGILDDFAVRKNVATKEGTVEKVPTNDSDIANKKYVDDLTGDHPHQDVQTTASPTFVKVSAPAGEFDTIATDTDGDITFLNDCYFTNRTGHDTFLDCVADEHIDWTDTTEDFKTTGSGSFGEGLEVNKNTTNQVGLTLNGIDVGGPFGPRGGFVKWFLNDRFVGGYTFMNDRQEIVFDTTIQATSADQGNAFINVMNGSAGFAGGDLTISSTGELETSSNINIASDTNGLQLGAGQDVKLYSNGSSGNFIFESDDKVQVRLGTTTTPFTTTFLQLEDGESHMGFNPGANLVDGIRVFEDSASGENRDFRIYGYPTGESNIYGQLKVTTGPVFTISSSNDEVEVDSNLDVTGKISSNTSTLTASSDDYDVSGINILFVTTAGGNVVLGGLKGGVDGQYLHIARKDATNDLTLEHLEGVGTQEIYMHEGTDETIDSWGGFTLVCDGSDWYDVSHAKHV